jgi:hypothetical protein
MNARVPIGPFTPNRKKTPAAKDHAPIFPILCTLPTAIRCTCETPNRAPQLHSSTWNQHIIGRSPVLAWQIARTSLPDSPYLVGSSPVVAWYCLRTRLEATPYLLVKYPLPRWHEIAFIYPVIRRLQKTNVL